MKKTYSVYFILIFNVWICAHNAGAEEPQVVEPSVGTISSDVKLQKPLTRAKPAPTSPPNESSSFIGDPDNIDPLKPNSESIKEDEEPVLEDIKQIKDTLEKKTLEKESLENKKVKPKVSEQSPDDPDLNIEKKFYNIYKVYNVNPTPTDVWSAATAKQTIREYVVQKGDTLWAISNILFGDPTFWPKIWALNKQGILNPHFITPKSKIYFYMGDEASAPTLAVGSPAAVLAEQGLSDESALPRGTIPDSLPVSRNEKYFVRHSKTKTKIELGELPRFDFENTSEIYITDQPVKTEVKIQLSETAKFRCYEGRILRDIRYNGKLVENYEIFEQLDSFETTLGPMHAYRVYGTAQPYQLRKLKMYNCKGILSSDLIIIPKEKIQTLRNTKLSMSKRAIVIGGPDVVEQRLFVPNQLAYVDFGSYEFSAGQEYKTRSQITDEINGHFIIMQKYGSFAVVMITQVNDVIEIGDKVILQ